MAKEKLAIKKTAKAAVALEKAVTVDYTLRRFLENHAELTLPQKQAIKHATERGMSILKNIQSLVAEFAKVLIELRASLKDAKVFSEYLATFGPAHFGKSDTSLYRYIAAYENATGHLGAATSTVLQLTDGRGVITINQANGVAGMSPTAMQAVKEMAAANIPVPDATSSPADVEKYAHAFVSTFQRLSRNPAAKPWETVRNMIDRWEGMVLGDGEDSKGTIVYRINNLKDAERRAECAQYFRESLENVSKVASRVGKIVEGTPTKAEKRTKAAKAKAASAGEPVAKSA